MNKDALLATIIGFGIGLVITGALLLGPTISKSFPSITLPAISLPIFGQQASQPTPTPQPHPTGLTITSPLAESIEAEDELLVSGTAPVESLVVIQSEVGEAVVKTNGDGAYAGKIGLVEGENQLVVTAYKDGKSTVQTVTVFYTPEEL